MKIKHITLGLIVAGIMIMQPSLAWAQYTTEPIYTTLKLLYGKQMGDGFNTSGHYGGYFDKSTGVYKGDDRNSKAFGGGLAIGYDFGALNQLPVRVELEYLYRRGADDSFGTKNTSNVDSDDFKTHNVLNSSHSVKADIHSVFANVYYDFRNDSGMIPYVGAGLGVAYIDVNLNSRYDGTLGATDIPHPEKPDDYDDFDYNYPVDHNSSGSQHSTNIAWNVGAGVSYYINQNFTLDLAYRYSDFGEAEFGTKGYNIIGEAMFTPKPTPGNDGDPIKETVNLGTYSGKGKMKFTSHEVILGLRFTGY